MRATFVVVLSLVVTAACYAFTTLGQIELRTRGTGGGMVYVTRTLPGGCDGGGDGTCVSTGGCGGSGDGAYLCGMAFEPGYPVRLAASAWPGSSFGGWLVTVKQPEGAATALPPDPSAVKLLTPQSALELDIQARFDPVDAGSD